MDDVKTDETIEEEIEETEHDEQTEEAQGGEGSGEGEKTVEAWQLTEDEQTASNDTTVPLGAHVALKKKLKGRLSEKDDEISRLRSEIDALKGQRTDVQVQAPGKRPDPLDFKTDAEYELALDAYDSARFSRIARQSEATRKQELEKQRLSEKVEAHYERAAKLVQAHGIDPALYKQGDTKVRSALDTVFPGRGDTITDHLISVIGEGSEKVLHHFALNSSALAELQSKLLEDPNGLQAAIFIGQKKAQLLSPVKIKSKASPPGAKLPNGGDSISGSALKRKYEAAEKKDDPQLMYNIKKQARASGIDVSNW